MEMVNCPLSICLKRNKKKIHWSTGNLQSQQICLCSKCTPLQFLVCKNKSKAKPALIIKIYLGASWQHISSFKPLEVGNIKVQMMQEKEHTVYVYRMIKMFNKEVRALFNRLDIKQNNTND
jgi:hypothetical protein